MSRKALKLVKFEEASNSKLNGDGTAQPKFRNRLRWNPWLQSKVNLKTTTVLNEAAAQTDCKGIIERRLNDELSNWKHVSMRGVQVFGNETSVKSFLSYHLPWSHEFNFLSQMWAQRLSEARRRRERRRRRVPCPFSRSSWWDKWGDGGRGILRDASEREADEMRWDDDDRQRQCGCCLPY